MHKSKSLWVFEDVTASTKQIYIILIIKGLMYLYKDTQNNSATLQLYGQSWLMHVF